MKKVTAFKSKSGKLYETIQECLESDTKLELAKLFGASPDPFISGQAWALAEFMVGNYEKFTHVFKVFNHNEDKPVDSARRSVQGSERFLDT